MHPDAKIVRQFVSLQASNSGSVSTLPVRFLYVSFPVTAGFRFPVRFRGHPVIILGGGLEHFLFVHVLGIIIPTAQLTFIFVRGVETTNQLSCI